ncbi:formyltransferase family protein [Psychromonas aquimarina]|uniref:formyltransferase family protein n=1 Tax=Psychromonas aquimarina TaxID=444919 RepID=UPI00040C26E3|nr:formyltransferase family protein [Psychromonas aquimarina]
MKIGFIGCVESSLLALNTLVNMDNIEVSAVITRKESAVNSDFVDLSQVCIENKIPYFYEDPNDREASIDFFKKFKLDVIYCFGWSYLLRKELLDLPVCGVIGFHPAKLPMNRGRHPIIWTLALGLDETASTFFKMDEGADSGPILSQELIAITTEDNATSLYKKVLAVANKQIINFTNDLSSGTAVFNPQDDKKATYWRKRSRKDGLIDWRMSAVSIHNLIRALAPPYPGAEFSWNGELVPVISSSIAVDSYAQNIEPGKVLSKKRNSILVKCAEKNAIWIHNLDEQELPDKGEYL